MIPNHIRNDLGSDGRLVDHRVEEPADATRTDATQAEANVLATHLSDKAALLELIVGRERDLGGEG